MNIIFNEVLKEKGIGFTKEFIIDQSLNLRANEEKGKLIVKLRNLNYEKSGRKLRIEELEKVNQVVMEEDVYSNLEYTSHELYIHIPKGEFKEDILCEDMTITFKKGDDIVG